MCARTRARVYVRVYVRVCVFELFVACSKNPEFQEEEEEEIVAALRTSSIAMCAHYHCDNYDHCHDECDACVL